MTPPARSPLTWVQSTMSALWREMLKFGIVGAVAFVVDVGVMNLLRAGALEDKPTTAKIISASVATVVAWIGNRQWTFRHRRNRRAHHEFTLFAATNGVALALGAGTIAFSHYVLQQQTLLADNIANVFGIGLGTLFRFWAYRTFVFATELEPASERKSAKTAGAARSNSSLP